MPTSHVVVREPGEFISSLPSMLGFVPERSLVVALLDQPTAIPLAGRARVAVVIRIDLDDSLGDFADVVGQVCAQTSCVAALLVLVDDRLDVPPTGPLRQYTASQRALIKALGYQLADFGIAVNGAWASRRIGADNPWWSLLGPSRRGLLPDPAASEAAARFVTEGSPVLASRSQLLALVEADQPTADRVRELLPTSQATERRRQLDLLQRGAPDAYGRRGLELVLGHIASVETGSFPEVSQIVDVAVALRDPRVRNSVLATALSEHAHVAETLWAYLTRTLPGHDRAGAATLLGYSAYVRGNGPLAGIALRAVLDADPEHPMALLLEIALQIGIHPRKVRELARSGAEEAAALGIPIEIDPGAR